MKYLYLFTGLVLASEAVLLLGLGFVLLRFSRGIGPDREEPTVEGWLWAAAFFAITPCCAVVALKIFGLMRASSMRQWALSGLLSSVVIISHLSITAYFLSRLAFGEQGPWGFLELTWTLIPVAIAFATYQYVRSERASLAS
jgi:hypothetical protein